MTIFSRQAEHFVAELDAAIQWHLDWTRRVLRCAVLRTTPGEDVLASDSHRRCRFGGWFESHLQSFEALDAASTARVTTSHRRMHDAVRALCTELLAIGEGSPAQLDLFEESQAALVTELAQLKTLILDHSARQDALTGLPLRHGLEEEFERCQGAAARHGEHVVAMMVDVDHFKRVNDVHGHAVGDQALRHVAALLRAQARVDEPVFRFGGEEFLVLLHVADREAASLAAERLLQAFRDAPLALDGAERVALRVSAGLSQTRPDEPMAHALERADRALYVAKKSGRDCWRWAT